MNESEFRIVSTEHDGGLCHDAEHLLLRDLERDDIALINDAFIMKMSGRHVMVALERQEVDGGTISTEYWYEPDWYVLRSTLDHKAGYHGQQRLYVPGVFDIAQDRKIRGQTRGTPMTKVLKMAFNAAERLMKLPMTEVQYPLPYPPHLYDKVWRGEE